jgi:hypothetical protein
MKLKLTNNAAATLASAISAGATSVSLTAGGGALFPSLAAGEYFFATLIDASNSLEVLKVTARVGDTLTVLRAQDNTSAKAYAAGDKCELRLVAAVFNELIQRDGSVVMTASLDHGGFKAINIADPTAAQDAATKNYVDTTAVAAVNAEAATRLAADNAEATARSNADAGKVNLDGGNATGTWAGTTEWTRVNNRPTALSQFSNDRFFENVSGLARVGSGALNCNGNTGNCWPGSAAVNCYGSGNVQAMQLELTDNGTSVGIRGVNYNYNCNCNCACDCCCCFAKGTLVRMADGSVKEIEKVMVGEMVKGLVGDVCVAHKFDTTLKGNSLWKLNGDVTVTGGHLFLVNGEWAAIDMDVYPHGVFFRSEQEFDESGLVDIKHQTKLSEVVRQLKVGDIANGVEVLSIERVDADSDVNVHNMIVNGGDAFILATGVAVDGFMRQSCKGMQ